MATRAAPARSWGWLQGLVCGGLAVAAPGIAVLVAVLLLPVAIMYATGFRQSAGPTRAMLLAGTAASFSPLRSLWEGGGTLNAALDVLSDPGRPLMAWLSCGLAWIACEGTAFLIAAMAQAKRKRDRHALDQERKALVDEWSVPGSPD